MLKLEKCPFNTGTNNDEHIRNFDKVLKRLSQYGLRSKSREVRILHGKHYVLWTCDWQKWSTKTSERINSLVKSTSPCNVFTELNSLLTLQQWLDFFRQRWRVTPYYSRVCACASGWTVYNLLLYQNIKWFLLKYLLFLFFKTLQASSDSCHISRSTVEIVEDCPNNEEQWKEAAIRKNCAAYASQCSEPERLEYHCVINQFINQTIEVCAYAQNIVLGKLFNYDGLNSN